MREPIKFALGAARVFDLSKEFEKRRKRLHGNPRVENQVASLRSQTFR
jgi:hypothetical protein